MYETNKRYQEVFRSKMGNLGEKFFRLFRKAVPFSPIMDVAGFISEFVCDVEHRLDIEDMRENIRHYRRLEENLTFVEKKVARLEQIRDVALQVTSADERILVYRYLLDRADLEGIRERLAQVERDIQTSTARSQELTISLEECDAKVSQLRARRDELIEQRSQNDVFLRQQHLHQKQQVLEARFANLRTYGERLSRTLTELRSRWTAALNLMQPALSWLSVDAVSATAKHVDVHPLQACADLLDTVYNEAQTGLRDVPQVMDWRSVKLQNVDVPALRANWPSDGGAALLKRAKEHLDAATDGAREVVRLISSQVGVWRDELKGLDATIANLRRGIKRYDEKVLRLQGVIRDTLSARYGDAARVDIFADTLDLTRDTWQRAIEGYLHTQRFYLLVAPQHFQDALRVYNDAKAQLRIFDAGLVDVGRILEQNSEVVAGSLAEQVVTDHPYGKAYTNFLLGRVMKSDTVEALRCHRTAVTEDGMLYQNFVARQMDPKRWETLYVGKRAIEQQLAQATTRREVVQGLLSTWEARLSDLSRTGFGRLPTLTDDHLADVVEADQALQQMPAVVDEFRSVSDELANLDLSFLLTLDEQMKAVDADVTKTEREHTRIVQEQRDVENRLHHLKTAEHDSLSRSEAQAASLLEREYDAVFVESQGEARFEQELSRLGSASAITTNFGRQKQVDENRRNTA